MILCILPPARQKPQTAQTRAFSQLRPVQQFANFYICSYSNNTDGHRFNTDVARNTSLSHAVPAHSLLSQPLGGLQLAPRRSQNNFLRIILYFVKSGRRGASCSPPSVCESNPHEKGSKRLSMRERG